MASVVFLFIFLLSVLGLTEAALPSVPSTFRPSKWLSGTKEDTNYHKRTSILSRLSVRGGSSDQESKASKVKGLCVGIDLGTTYRFVWIITVMFNNPIPIFT